MYMYCYMYMYACILLIFYLNEKRSLQKAYFVVFMCS